MSIYCGNNKFNPDLISNKLKLGTRYECLKKGIGKGLNLPVDSRFLEPYEPIDETKIYCGDKDVLPDESYDRFGNLVSCLQKGIGIGKRKKALENKGIVGKKSLLSKFDILYYIIILIISSILIFTTLYYTKPSFIVEKSRDGINKIDNVKFSLYGTLFSFILSIVVFSFFKLFKRIF